MSDILTTHTMVNLSSFYDYVMPDLPSCPQKLVDQAIRNAAINFCQQTRMWRVSLDALTVTAGEAQIELDLPDNSEVFELKRVKLDGKTLNPATEAELFALNNEWDTETGTPTDYLQMDQGVITLVPIPTEGSPGGLSLQAILRPTESAVKLPDLIHKQTLAMGAKGELMMMSKKPWTDQNLGNELSRQFAISTGSLAAKAAKGFAAPLRSGMVHGIR